MSALRHLVRVPSPSLIVAVAALLVATTGAALAAIPDANDVIHGCITNRTGALRVIDSEAGQTCTSKETPLNWNQTGPPGSVGATYLRTADGISGVVATCDSGDFATGGGAYANSALRGLSVVFGQDVPRGYQAVLVNEFDQVTVEVLCVDNSP